MSSRKDGAGEKAATLAWHRSSFCAQGECVEIAVDGGMVLIRDSKAPRAGTLRFSSDEFDAFIRGAVAGEFSNLLAR